MKRILRLVFAGLLLSLACTASVQGRIVEAQGITLPSQQTNYKTQAIERSRAKAILTTIARLTHGVPESSLTGVTAKEALDMSQSFVRGYTILTVAERDLLYRVNVAWDVDEDALEALLLSRLLDTPVACTVLIYHLPGSNMLWSALDALGTQNNVSLEKFLVMDDSKVLVSLQTLVAPKQMITPLMTRYEVRMDESCYIIVEARKENAEKEGL